MGLQIKIDPEEPIRAEHGDHENRLRYASLGQDIDVRKEGIANYAPIHSQSLCLTRPQ